MASDNERPIIIKKVIKVAGHGHHGGSWKVAYADFVTAMMAFFLLLWLLNVTTDEKKMGIADYFAPASISRSQSGSGAILGGSAMTVDGAMRTATAPQTVVVKIDTPMQDMQDTGEKQKDKDFDKQKDKDFDKQKDKDNDFDRPTQRAEATPTDATLQRALAEREQKAFEDSAEQLRLALAKNPELNGLAKHLLIDQTPEGLRIQIVDQDRESMFPVGSARMPERTRQLLGSIAQVMNKLPNRVSITGHTDATPYRSENGYGNWELSSDRANASRRMLIESGIQQQRVVQVSGKADTEPLFPTDPFQPGNRRIAIVLLRDAQLAPGAAPQSVVR
jgi:chemotaxis protein MotB